MALTAGQTTIVEGLINERVTAAIAGIRTEFQVDVARLTNGLSEVDVYAKNITERVSEIQRISQAAMQLISDTFETKAKENEVKASEGVETIRGIVEQVDRDTREAIASLKVAADMQKQELGNIQAAQS